MDFISLVILMDGGSIVYGDHASYLGGELSIASGGSLKIKGYSEVINGENHYWKNVTIFFTRPSNAAWRQDEGALANNGSLEIESAKILTANPIKFNGTLNKLKGVDLLNYNTIGANSATRIETRCLQTVDFEDVITDTTISIFNDDNIFKGMVFVKSQFKIINKAANLVDGNKRPIEFIGFESLNSEGSIGGSPQVSMKNTEDGSEFPYKGIFLNLAVSKTEQQIKFKAKDISNSIIGEVKWYFTETDDGNSPRNAYTWDRELLAGAGFRLYESNLNTIRNLIMAGDSVTGETTTETILTRLFWKNDSSYVYDSTDSSTDDYINVTTENPVYDSNQTEGFKNNYRLSGGVTDTHIFYFRRYGFLFGSQTVLLRKNKSEVSAESTLNSNPNLVKTQAQVLALNQLTNLSDLYDYSQYLEWTDNDYAFLEGYNNELLTIEGTTLVLNSNWSLIIKLGTNSKPITYNTAIKIVTIYVSSSFIATNLFNYLKAKNITFDGNVTVDFIYEYLSGSDIVTNHIFDITVSETNIHWNLHVIGIKNSVNTTLKKFHDYSNNVLLNLEIKRDLYDSIEMKFFGDVVENYFTRTVANFSTIHTILLNVENQAIAGWITDRTNGITIDLANSNTELTFVGSWGSAQDLDQLHWNIERTISDYNKNNPENHLNADNFMTKNGQIFNFVAKITNTNFPKNLGLGGFTSIVFTDANQSYLTQDIGILSETATRKVYSVNNLLAGDILKIQESDTPNTLSSVDITTSYYNGILDKSKTYDIRLYRVGYDSPYYALSAINNVVNPAFISLLGLTYDKDTNKVLNDYFSYDSTGIYLKQDFVANTDEYVAVSQSEIDLLFEYNNLAPAGIKNPHILNRQVNGFIVVNYNLKTELSHTNDSVNYYKNILIANQYITEIDGIVSRPQKEISFLPRATIENTVDGGFTPEAMALAFKQIGFDATAEDLTQALILARNILQSA